MKINPGWPLIPGESPIDDISGLLVKDIGTRRQLNQVEAENITLAAVKYLGETSPIREAYLAAIQAADRLDYAPLVALHKQHTPG